MSAALSSGPDEPAGSGLPGDAEEGIPQGLYVTLPAEELSLEGFAEDGRADTMAPGPLLAMVLGTVAGEHGEDLARLSDDQLVGFLSGTRRMESRLAWARMAALAEFASRPRRQDFAADEIAAAFHLTWLSAAGEIEYAQTVARRLPVTFAALAAGKIDPVHVKIIEDFTSILSDEDAALADEILAAAAQAKTYGELRRAATRLVLKLDPEAVRKRKEKARREARVRSFREESGNAGITGREMPSVEVLASMQHVEDRARALRDAGVPGTWEELKVRATLDLLQERDSRPAPGEPSAGGGSAGAAVPARTRAAQRPATRLLVQPGGPGGPAVLVARSRPWWPGSGPAPGSALECQRRRADHHHRAAHRAGRRHRPAGEVDGFGILDHADTRDLIAAAARNPATRWCVTVLNPDGTAAAHGCAAGTRRWPPGQGPPGQEPPGQGPPGPVTLSGLLDLLNIKNSLRSSADRASTPRPRTATGPAAHSGTWSGPATRPAPRPAAAAAPQAATWTTPTLTTTAAGPASATWPRSVSDNHTGCPLGSGSGARSCTTRTTTAGSLTRARSRSATRARSRRNRATASGGRGCLDPS